MNQLRNNLTKSEISRHAPQFIAVEGADPAAIHNSNFVHKSFSGNHARLGVTYPAVLNSLPGAPSFAPRGDVRDFSAELRMTLGSTIFMADLLPEGCSKIQTDGGSSGYDKVE
jgi:hypothetical protein